MGAQRNRRASRADRARSAIRLRSLELADRVAAGQRKFIDAVGLAREAAQRSGLVEAIGDDLVQFTLAGAFANARRP
jgi:hypothetical protein